MTVSNIVQTILWLKNSLDRQRLACFEETFNVDTVPDLEVAVTQSPVPHRRDIPLPRPCRYCVRSNR